MLPIRLRCWLVPQFQAKKREGGEGVLDQDGGRAILANGTLSFDELPGKNVSACVVGEMCLGYCDVSSSVVTIARTRTAASRYRSAVCELSNAGMYCVAAAAFHT